MYEPGWPIDWADLLPEDADPQHVMYAAAYAGATLRMLTLYQVGGPEVTVRPSGLGCRARGGLINPFLYAGEMRNSCGCDMGCDCPPGKIAVLDPPVGYVLAVTVNGQALEQGDYHLEDGYRLVRDDGGTFPSCPSPDCVVTYLHGHEVDMLGRRVGGLLAFEFYRSIIGDRACRLPPSVTSISRQGVTMSITPGAFPDGLTGISEVDTYVKFWNPHGLSAAPQVYSPDLARPRRVTWP